MTQTAIERQSSTKPKNHGLKVADSVWIAAATLHREYPQAIKFRTEDIVAQVQQLQLTEATYRSIWQHVNQHCVANREPNPNRTRMLWAHGNGDRSLWRTGDSYKPAREGSPTHPNWAAIPEEYRDLKEWYQATWNKAAEDPLLELVGSGKHLWKDESGDEFIARIRSNWGGVE